MRRCAQPRPSAERSSEKGSVDGCSWPSSVTLRSSSVYRMPFCTKLISWPGGIFTPLMFDLATMLSAPKVKAECRNPDSCRYRYTRKLSSSDVMDMPS